MNREFKFRIWDNMLKCWLKDKVYIANNGLIDNFGVFSLKQHPSGYTIQQYTGLTDRQKREIYEGDIVEYKWSNKVFRAVVKWEHFSFYLIDCFDTAATPLATIEMEVIGNIFDTPELLKS